MLEDVVQSILLTSFLIVSLFYLSYFLVLYHFYRKVEKKDASLETPWPHVSLIVPAYNEQKVIYQKIKNIDELDYPKDKIEVVIVDDCSTDDTSDMIRSSMEKCNKPTKLIESTQRSGYNCAISKGILNSEGEIIVVTDAGAYHYPGALKHLIRHFNDTEVGAVTGKEIVLSGHEKNFGPKLEGIYRNFYDFMRIAETRIDSTPDSKGEILAARRDICMHLLPRLEISPDVYFDTCIPYQAKLAGYRTLYDPSAMYSEYGPATFMDRMKQQTRRATSLVGALVLFRGMLLRRKYGRFGAVILPAHFIMQCLLPWIFLLGVGCLLILTMLNPVNTVFLWIIAVGAVAVEKTRLFLISFVQSQVALAAAIFRLITRRENSLIETIPSTRKQ